MRAYDGPDGAAPRGVGFLRQPLWHIEVVEYIDAQPIRRAVTPFRLLPTVAEAYQAMLYAIQGAVTSVRLEMYIFTASPVGEEFRQALVAAARRGVTVKVMLDGFGSMTLRNAFWDPLREAGGSVRWFNPVSLRRFAFRNHRKSLVCDEGLAFVGGFNVATEYEGDGVVQGWHDVGLCVRGRLAAELAASFDWLYERAEAPHRMFVRLRKGLGRQRVEAPEGHLLTSGPGRGRQHLRDALLDDIRRARDIRVASAYFLPPRRLRRALRQAARSGRRVLLLMAGKSDVPLAQRATRGLYSALLRAGVTIYEYQPQILHTKLFVLDDTVYVGSANLNLRSLHIDYELMVRVENPLLAEEARAVIDEALVRSEPIDGLEWRRSRSFWTRLFERWSYFVVARVDPLIAGRQLRALR